MLFLDVCGARHLAILAAAVVMLVGCSAGVEEPTGSASAQVSLRWSDVSLRAVAYDAAPVNDLAFLSAERGWLLTHSQLLETNDAGRNWAARYAGGGRQYFSALLFSDARTGWIVGSSSGETGDKALILHTADGGRSWSEQPISIGRVPATQRLEGLRGLSRCGSTLWAVGDSFVVQTLNDGRTWKARYVSTGGNRLTDIVCADPERVLAVGAGGIILQSRDGGETWNRQASGVTANLFKARHFGGMFWVVGADGVVMRAGPDSLRWERLPKVTSEPLYDIYLNGARGWAVGEHGTMLHTSDGGDVWRQHESPTKSALTSLYFIHSNQGWAGGSALTLLHLSD